MIDCSTGRCWPKGPVGPESPTLQRGLYGEGQLQCPASPRTTQGEAAATIRIPHSPIPGHSVAPERTLISVTATQCPPTEARRSAGSLPELQCWFTRCRYLHICSDWSRSHAAIHCPHHRATPVNRGPHSTSTGLGLSPRAITRANGARSLISPTPQGAVLTMALRRRCAPSLTPLLSRWRGWRPATQGKRYWQKLTSWRAPPHTDLPFLLVNFCL